MSLPALYCKYYNKMVVVKSGKYNCQYKQVCQV